MTDTVPVTVAARGVDTDCGHCAGEGIERLREAAPEFDWDQLVHDVQRHEDDYPPYWCHVCPDIERPLEKP